MPSHTKGNDTIPSFSEKRIALRRQRGLSQEQLGAELGVSRQTVSKWEGGQSCPDFQRLVLLSDFFELSLDELVRDPAALRRDPPDGL